MPADVVVIGAGLAGLAVAASLRSRRVTVVDGSAPGSEATAQNAGMLRRMGEDPYERALAVETHRRMEADPWLAEVSRRVGAWLVFGRDPTHLHDAAAHLEVAGVARRWVERPQAEVGLMAGAPLRGGWFLPDERVVDAWALVGRLRARLEGAGGAIQRWWVERIEPIAGGWRVVGGGGAVDAREVVIAAGAWSAALVRPLGVERPLFPLRRTLLLTDPHPAATADHPWCWVDDEGVYARAEGGGFLISGCDEAVDFPSGPGSRGPVEPVPRAIALDKVARWFPALDGLRFRAGWSGLRTFAPDRRPVLGADPALPGVWWCAGLGGFGVSCGLAAGELVAGWMEGRDGCVRPAGVSPGRPMLRTWFIRPDGDLAGATPVDGRLPQEGAWRS